MAFHETVVDAENDVNQLLSPYTNIVPNLQIVYARLTNLATDCYDVIELELIVADTPAANLAPDLILVDNNGDGVEVFDLTVNEIIITGGDPAASVTYFETLADSNAIVNPTSYISSTNVIFVRVENASFETVA